ncbi:MAG: S-adenosyl-l-methionine hydroxide adenosyltransferase family protein [Candidatus Heimdallarchaeota archaeon]
MIVLLTDFGDTEYVGVMKGVIYSIVPQAKVVDLYNQVSPQNIREGAWILLQNYKFFPYNTIFLCVVDPGVGSGRNALGVETQHYIFVGPDNGLVYPTVQEDGLRFVVRLSEEGASRTFHGRDVFARAAAELEKGTELELLGEAVEIACKFEFQLDLKNRIGEIVRIDTFGNIVTNLPHIGKQSYTVTYGKFMQQLSFYKTYEAAPENMLFLIEGSSNTLEISLKNAKAINRLVVQVGELIQIN